MPWLLKYLRNVFTVDLRALAVMRIWLAGIVLIDLGIRATDLEAHYTNLGVMPLHALYHDWWNPFYLSVHSVSGLWQGQAFLFLLNAGFAVCLLLGYRTRLATVCCWLLMLSLQNRNPFVLQGGDDLFRMLLFWGIFLPWGRFYSLDSIRNKSAGLQPQQTGYFSAATAAYVLQICIVYTGSALLKNSPEWHTDGTALYYALSLDQVLMPGGKLLYPYPELLKFLTLATWYTELWLPVLLLIPVYTTFFRLLVVGILTSFHIGISLTLFVGLFYLISLASFTGLLPGYFMDKAEPRLISGFNQLYVQVRKICQPVQWPVKFTFNLALTTPLPVKGVQRRARETVVLFFLVYVLWWNIDNTGFRQLAMPEQARWVGHLFRVDQNWGMFAPEVFKDDGWYVLEGHTRNEKMVALNQQGKEPDYVKPASVMATFKNDRWRKYSENYLFISYAAIRPYYCHYLMRRWNEDHPDNPVKALDVVYMKERTLPDYMPSVPRREVLCTCSLE